MRKTLFFLLVLLSSSRVLSSQNLVDNPGFEKHLKPLVRLQRATFLENAEFAQMVKGWTSQGYAAYSSLFSTRYKPQKWQEELGYNFRKCSPHSGHSMLRISVLPKGGSCGRGAGGYVQTRLKAPALPGKTYAAGCWIFVPDTEADAHCPGFIRHFGLALSGSEMKLHNPECMLINSSPMLADTIRTANWYHLMRRFTPADTLNYLFIGAFYNPAAPYRYQAEGGGCDFGFFIDDVELTETPENAPAPLYPGPESTEVQRAKVDTETRYFVYFDSNSDTLTAAAEASLDTVVALARSDMRSVFQINGHADILGAGNEALSERRAHRVKTYLEQKGVLPGLRLELHAYGSDSLAADNATERGRRLSRRVEIRKSDKDLPFILYKSAGQMTDADSACRLLQAWLRFPTSDGMLLLHDPDLNQLHAYSSWTRLTEQIKASYGKFKNPALAYELEHLYFKDQRYRSLAGVFLEAKGSVPRLIDSLSQDARIQHVSDSLNAEEAVRLLGKYGWADPATVGARAASAPFYPIQHAENLSQMKQALKTLQLACEKQYVPWLEYAMLYDRTQLIETGLQHFGTQYRVDQNDPSLYRLAPLDDPANIDTIRAKLNLGLLDTTSTFRVLLKRE